MKAPAIVGIIGVIGLAVCLYFVAVLLGQYVNHLALCGKDAVNAGHGNMFRMWAVHP